MATLPASEDQARDTVLVCFAMREEAAPFRRLAPSQPEIRILVTGVGRKNSEASLRRALAAHPPGLVLTCGYAGGLSPELAVGQVVFAADELLDLRSRLLAAGARQVRFHCADHMVTTAVQKRILREITGADAVEMESEIIRGLCRERGILSATVRVISDPAHEDLPLDFNLLMTPRQTLDPTRLVWAILKSPSRIPALFRLRRHTRLAGCELARALVMTFRL